MTDFVKNQEQNPGRRPSKRRRSQVVKSSVIMQTNDKVRRHHTSITAVPRDIQCERRAFFRNDLVNNRPHFPSSVIFINYIALYYRNRMLTITYQRLDKVEDAPDGPRIFLNSVLSGRTFVNDEVERQLMWGISHDWSCIQLISEMYCHALVRPDEIVKQISKTLHDLTINNNK